MRKMAIFFPYSITSSGVENSEYRSYIACSNGLHPFSLYNCVFKKLKKNKIIKAMHAHSFKSQEMLECFVSTRQSLGLPLTVHQKQPLSCLLVLYCGIYISKYHTATDFLITPPWILFAHFLL